MGASAVLRISFGWGRPVYKWPHFLADLTGTEAWGTNRQTLVSLAAAKSLPWCMQHALSVAVISCDVAVSARYTFTHTHIHWHTYAQEPQGCPSCSCSSWYTMALSHLAASPCCCLLRICCRLISQWSRNCCHLSWRFCVKCVCVCVRVFVCMCLCACEKSVFFPFNLWSSAFFRWQLLNEIINNSHKNKSNCCCCCNNCCSS